MQGQVYFTGSNGRKLAGIIDRDESKSYQPVVIILGAFNSYKYSAVQEEVALYFKNLGFATFRFDYKGRGESEGKIAHATISTGIKDTKSAYEFIKNQLWSDPKEIGIFAFGIGAAYAIAAKSDDIRYKFLILSNPRAENDTFFENINIDDWRKNEYYYTRGINHHISIYDDAQKYDIYKLATQVQAPTLIVNTTGEETYIKGQDKRLKKAIKNATHKIINSEERVYCAHNKKEIAQIINLWLEEKCLIPKKSD